MLLIIITIHIFLTKMTAGVLSVVCSVAEC